MRFIGIDPGLTGAVAVIDENGLIVKLWDTPVVLLGSKKKVPDLVDFATKLTRFKVPDDGDLNKRVGKVCIEAQRGMPAQSSRSVFTLGYIMGMTETVVAWTGFPYEVVPPHVWKGAIMKGYKDKKDKKNSMHLAGKLFPNANLKGPKGGWKDGRAEALLIAEFARREMRGDYSPLIHVR